MKTPIQIVGAMIIVFIINLYFILFGLDFLFSANNSSYRISQVISSRYSFIFRVTDIKYKVQERINKDYFSIPFGFNLKFGTNTVMRRTTIFRQLVIYEFLPYYIIYSALGFSFTGAVIVMFFKRRRFLNKNHP